MIRPLRRWHRWLVPALLLVALAGVTLAMAFPTPSVRVFQIPQSVVEP